MDWFTSIFAIVLGILLRLAVPIAITLLGVVLLKWLDERWKRDGNGGRILKTLVKNIGCWRINHCPPEQRAQCAAFSNPNIPCWQAFRGQDGHLQERCLACEIFRRAPVPGSA
jgi:hypothetical protein